MPVSDSELPTTSSAERRLEVGPIILSLDRFTAQANGRALRLTRLEFDILAYLMRHVDRVVSQQELQRVVRGNFGIESSVIRVHVSHLRRKLGDCAAIIATIWGRGFRFSDFSPVTMADGIDVPVQD